MIKIYETTNLNYDGLKKQANSYGKPCAYEIGKFSNVSRYFVRIRFKDNFGYTDTDFVFDSIEEAKKFVEYVELNYGELSKISDTYGGYGSPMFT